jgi:hypothetical protein
LLLPELVGAKARHSSYRSTEYSALPPLSQVTSPTQQATQALGSMALSLTTVATTVGMSLLGPALYMSNKHATMLSTYTQQATTAR